MLDEILRTILITLTVFGLIYDKEYGRKVAVVNLRLTMKVS